MYIFKSNACRVLHNCKGKRKMKFLAAHNIQKHTRKFVEYKQ